MANVFDHYILDEHGEPQECDLFTWARWFETAGEKRFIAKDKPSPDVEVYTVFLGLNHAWGDHPPLIFETMIFGGPHDSYCERYSTREEALEGHREAVEIALTPCPH